MNEYETESRKVAPPCILVIFGASGDLTKRLLYPSICNLGKDGLLDESFCIIGVAVEPYNCDSFREKLSKDIQTYITNEEVKKFAQSMLSRVFYISGNFTDATTYNNLKNKIDELSSERNNHNCIFYFAAPPEFMLDIAQALKKADLVIEKEGEYFRRLVVEKPFGHDYESAKNLNHELVKIVNENQIYRIDHFLGKETVQNVFAFRFSNGLFEPIWNRLYIDNIQITVAESLGVEQRGAYYEKAGALRDMIPNHLFQMLALMTMEPPVSFSGNDIQDERIKALSGIKIMTPEEVLHQTVRGQYSAGMIGSTQVKAYREEEHVAPDSTTETYVAMKIHIDNWRWLHVPFYLRTGKRMKSRVTEILIQFKSGPATLFSFSGHPEAPNLLRLFIQPDEGIALQFNAKKPGTTLELEQVEMKFKYSDYFGSGPKTGYETILYDCMIGEHLLFQNAEMVETCWKIVQPILDVWAAITPHDFPNYPAGTWGPEEADHLLQKDGKKWLI